MDKDQLLSRLVWKFAALRAWIEDEHVVVEFPNGKLCRYTVQEARDLLNEQEL